MSEAMCLFCGAGFYTSDDETGFCSQDCRDKWWTDDTEYTVPKKTPAATFFNSMDLHLQRGWRLGPPDHTADRGPDQPDPGPTVTQYGTYDGSEPWTAG